MRIPGKLLLSAALALPLAGGLATLPAAALAPADVATATGASATSAGANAATVAAPQGGDRTYVDCSQSASGDGSMRAPIASLADLNAMTFGPGDQILFKSGTTCTGAFIPQGSGQAGAPIVATTYGGKTQATIDGQGVPQAVLLKDVSYWTLENLHVTNPGTPTSGVARAGIQVESSSTATKTGITITNNTVDKTSGWGNKTNGGNSYAFSAGIVTMTDAGSGPFDQIRITDNSLSDTGGGGIKVTGTDNPTKNTNIYVGGNLLNRPGGDGIVIHNSVAPMVEHNTALDLGQGAYPFTGGNFAGMWAFSSSDPTFQYNVVGNSKGVVYDATAWDCDTSVSGTCLFQYNYSFGNAGGFFLDCVSGCSSAQTTTKIVLRDNVAQDDCRLSGGSGGQAVAIYNNTFYCPSRKFVDEMSAPKDIENNIFVAPSGTFTPSAGDVFMANTYYGGITPAPGDTRALTGDPGLQAPGSGQESLDLPGYRLLNTSDQIGSGVVVPNNGGRDYFGNPVSASAAPNRGAYNGTGVAPGALPVSALYNQTAVASLDNGRNGAITTDRQTMSAQALADAGLPAGQRVNALGATFTFHPQAVGRADNIKANGQQIAIGKHADSLVFLGFSAGGVDSGDIVIHYANGDTQTATLTLTDWHSATAQHGDQLVASGATSLIHTGSYNDGTVQTQDLPSSVFAVSVPVQENSNVKSVTLPAGSPFADAGLHIFDVQPVIGS